MVIGNFRLIYGSVKNEQKCFLMSHEARYLEISITAECREWVALNRLVAFKWIRLSVNINESEMNDDCCHSNRNKQKSRSIQQLFY